MSRSGEVTLSDNRKEFEKWYIIPNDDGTVAIRSVAHGSALSVLSDGKVDASSKACKLSGDDQKWFVERDGAKCRLLHFKTNKSATVTSGGMFLCEDRDSTPWTMELLSGEICFLSNSQFDRRISCSPFGNLKMAKDWEGWEAWRFIEAGDCQGELIITSWTHDKKVLSSNPDGKVYTTDKKLGDWEKWTVSKGSGGVLIESVAFPGRFLSYNRDSLFTVKLADSKKTPGIHWELDAANANTFYISSPSHDKRISSKSDCTLFSTGNRKAWEEWKVEKSASGGFTIFSCAHQKYLTSFSTGIIATSSEASHVWDIEESCHGGIHIISRKHKHMLHCDKSAKICTVTGQRAASETWTMEPRLPKTLSESQIWSMAGIGLGAIAAPLAVMGAVGVLGFTASGISAGSFAASMMSVEAIAAGGGVAVGGTVATLQSVGAVGLGFAGTTAAAAGGGTLAGAVARSNGMMKNGEGSSIASSEQGDGAMIFPSQHRPLCNWRLW